MAFALLSKYGRSGLGHCVLSRPSGRQWARCCNVDGHRFALWHVSLIRRAIQCLNQCQVMIHLKLRALLRHGRSRIHFLRDAFTMRWDVTTWFTCLAGGYLSYPFCIWIRSYVLQLSLRNKDEYLLYENNLSKMPVKSLLESYTCWK